MNIQTICIVGTGGVGGYFGGLMARKITEEHDETRKIFFIARGEHLARIQQQGLILNTAEHQGLICTPTLATENIAEVPIPDLYLICVKSYDLERVTQAIRQHMCEDTILLPLLNGVDSYERIRKIVTTGIVLPACVYVGTHIERPGVITQKGGDGVILCGYDPACPEFDSGEIIECFHSFGIKFTWNNDPYPAIWGKYIFIAAFGLVTASSGKTLGEVMANDALKQQVHQIMKEIVAIATKKGITLAENIVETSLEKGNNFPYETKTSYQRDVETPGKKNEGDLFGGAILRMGQEVGVPAPVTQSVFSAIQKKH